MGRRVTRVNSQKASVRVMNKFKWRTLQKTPCPTDQEVKVLKWSERVMWSHTTQKSGVLNIATQWSQNAVSFHFSGLSVFTEFHLKNVSNVTMYSCHHTHTEGWERTNCIFLVFLKATVFSATFSLTALSWPGPPPADCSSGFTG